MTDRLVKDVAKSLARKMERFGRREASRRIFATCMWGNTLFSLSTLLYDSALDCAQYVWGCWCRSQGRPEVRLTLGAPYPQLLPSSKEIATLGALVLVVTKRAVLASAALCANSAGYALGSYMHPTQGGPLLCLVFDAAAVATLSPLLRI